MPTRTTLYHALTLLLLAIVLGACSPLPKQADTPAGPGAARAAALLQQQQYLPASALYESLAARTPGPAGSDFLLQAIDSALQGEDIDRAERLARAARTEQTTTAQKQLLSLLLAEIEIARHHGDNALISLLGLEEASLPRDLHRRYLRDLADAYSQVGNLLESANTLIRLDRQLEGDPAARLTIQDEILRNLTALNERSLTELQPDPPDDRGGWMEIALLVKKYGADPESLSPHLADWRARYPDHPMLPELLQSSLKRLQAQVLQLDRIAILLPQQGRYAGAAQALRDGIMASYYELPEEKRPSLRFYDSSDPAKAWPLYSEAVADGAQAIIGPLQKEAVSQLLRAGQLDVPVLALNYVSEDTQLPQNLYMFSLDPEREAILVAERIWQQGHRYPVTLTPDDPWGQRLQKAFSERWQTLTGTTVEGRAYPADSADFSQPIQELFHLDLSNARHKRLQRWLGQRVEFEPRRRQDIDAIFLAARPQQAQSMHPQLAFFRAGDLPVYATSHAWTGSLTDQQLPDMRGILLPDIPLVAVTADRERLGQVLPGVLGPAVRLYAMGIDAFRLVPHLQRMQASPYESLDGQTGNLYMNREQRILRQLVWLKLGRPARIQGYSDRMDLDPLPPVGDESATVDGAAVTRASATPAE